MRFLKEMIFLGTLFMILFISNNCVYSQKRQLQTIRRVTVTNQYILKDGKNTGQSSAVYQEIFDSLGRLHTEIEYGFIDHYPHKYKWHTFNGKQVTRTDFFEKETLKMVKEFSYTKDSLLLNEIIRLVKPGDTSVYLSLNYKYNSQNKPIFIEAKTSNNKIAYISKSIYDSNGTELERKVSTKGSFIPLDSIIKMKCKPLYDSLGRLISNNIHIIKVKSPAVIKNISYKYDKKNNIIEILILDSQGKQVSREERIFQEARNRLSQKKFYDSDNKVIKWYGMRYEIYRNKNRRIYEIDY